MDICTALLIFIISASLNMTCIAQVFMYVLPFYLIHINLMNDVAAAIPAKWRSVGVQLKPYLMGDHSEPKISKPTSYYSPLPELARCVLPPLPELVKPLSLYPGPDISISVVNITII